MSIFREIYLLYSLPYYVIITNYFKKIFCILSVYIKDYNMCKNYFVSITNKENNAFDTPILQNVYDAYLPILIHGHNNPP